MCCSLPFLVGHARASGTVAGKPRGAPFARPPWVKFTEQHLTFRPDVGGRVCGGKNSFFEELKLLAA